MDMEGDQGHGVSLKPRSVQPPRTAKRAFLAGCSLGCLKKKACGGASGERQIFLLLLLLSEAVPLC